MDKVTGQSKGSVRGGEPGRGDALATWRRRGAGRLDVAELAEARAALSGPVLVHHRRWPAVLRGDGAAAVAVALELMRRPAPQAALDLALSALAVRAAEGDRAADLVLAHAVATLPPR